MNTETTQHENHTCHVCAEVGLKQKAHHMATVHAGMLNGTPDEDVTVALCFECVESLHATVTENL